MFLVLTSDQFRFLGFKVVIINFLILFLVGLCDHVYLLFRAEFSAVKFLCRRDLQEIFLFSVHSPHSWKKICLTQRLIKPLLVALKYPFFCSCLHANLS